MHPTDIGARAEAAVTSALVRAGRSVFLPIFGVNTRIASCTPTTMPSCASSARRRIVGQVVFFRSSSNTNNVPREYTDEIDKFGVYSPSLNLVYLVPVRDVPLRYGSLRLSPKRNGQRKRIMWADDYVLGPP